MKLSLDDQLKLAIAAGHGSAWITNENYVTTTPSMWSIFKPTSPDTLMRLMFNLKIDVEWFGGFEEWKISADIDTDEDVGWAKTPEEIADAIIACSLQVIKECGE